MTRISQARLTHLTVSANSADLAGGGIGFELSGAVILKDSGFVNNSASVGGALVAHSSSLSLQAVKFTGNLATLVEEAPPRTGDEEDEESGEGQGQDGEDAAADDDGGGGGSRRRRRLLWRQRRLLWRQRRWRRRLQEVKGEGEVKSSCAVHHMNASWHD
jgi:hypothetical protein